MPNTQISRLGSLQDLYAGMVDAEVPLRGAPAENWPNGVVNMGNQASGEGTPSWWNPTDPQYKTGDWLTCVGWWVIWAGANHVADNTSVTIRNLQVWILRTSTNEWFLANQGGTDLAGQDSAASNVTINGDGSRTYAFNGNLDRMHGWVDRFSIPPTDIRAMYVRAEAMLVKTNQFGSDDRDASEILFCVGADYWPDFGITSADIGPDLNPGVGNSAFKLLGSEPRVYQFATIMPSRENLGYSINPRSLETFEFENNLPPPLRSSDLSGKVSIDLTLSLKKSMNLGYAEYPINLSMKNVFQRGFGDSEAVASFIDTREISASGSESIDLSGGLNSSFGSALMFTRVKALIIKADDSNTNDVLVGGGTDAFSALFGDASDKFRVKPGGTVALIAPQHDGYIVKGDSADILSIANSGGGTSVIYTVILIGTM